MWGYAEEGAFIVQKMEASNSGGRSRGVYYASVKKCFVGIAQEDLILWEYYAYFVS